MKPSLGNRKPSITNLILRWYSRSARDLPWRDEKNPYRILVSEVMLQQTQISRVMEKYPRFIKRFPTLSSLAGASTATVIRAWKGMGYNNRAVRLQKLARTVSASKGERLPRTVYDLESLPGIGRYTANAVACFAFGQQVPVVDTNIRRVLNRIYLLQAKRLDIWELARLSLPERRAYDWNQALMDLGSTICTASNPKCGICPVLKLCPSSFRVKKNRIVRPRTEASHDGLPNRIYRGRIVETLRYYPLGKYVSTTQLGPRIKDSYSVRDQSWLIRLMKGLQKDGLIDLTRTKVGLAASLPR